MNRTSAAALAVAAVLGITGGTYAATLGLGPDGGKDPGASDSPSKSDTPTPTPSDTTTTPAPTSPAQLLYMDAAQIHDGYTRVAVEDIDIATVRSLVRISGGWLVVQGTSEQEPAFTGTVVRPDGTRTELGAFDGLWDINEDGTQLVAHHEDGYRVTNLADLKAVKVDLSAPSGLSENPNAAFAGNAVLTGWQDDAGNVVVRRTDLKTGASTEVLADDLHSWTASPRGLLMVGGQLDDERPCTRGGRVQGDHADWWRTCDWTPIGLRPRYTPNGERILVVPAETDGFGPGLFGILDSETGREVGEIDAPDWTIDGEWGDNDEVFLLGQRSGDDESAVIRRCKVDGECVVEKESPKRLVLGSGT